MNTSKVLQLRSLVLRSSMLNARYISLVPNHNRHLTKTLANDPLDFASSLMRDLEREFQRTRKQLERSFFNFDTGLLSLPSEKSSIDPIVVDKDGNRRFLMVFNLKGFTPEEIKVKTEGSNLCISAKKEQETTSDYFLNEFSETYLLPQDLKLEELKSKWDDNGLLTIEAPLPKQTEKPKAIKEIKIEHLTPGVTKKDTNA